VTNCGIFTTKEGSRAFHRALGGLAMARGKLGLPATETKRQRRGGHPHLDTAVVGGASCASTRCRRRRARPPAPRRSGGGCGLPNLDGVGDGGRGLSHLDAYLGRRLLAEECVGRAPPRQRHPAGRVCARTDGRPPPWRARTDSPPPSSLAPAACTLPGRR
jgi:hypothetical protein